MKIVVFKEGMARRSKKTVGGRRERQQTRRLEAARLFGLNQTRAEVVEACGVSWRAVHGWYQRWQQGGRPALLSTRKPGPAPKFNERHIRTLEIELHRGARVHRDENELWTVKRVRRLIQDRLTLRCSESEAWLLLRRMKWSPQSPRTQGGQDSRMERATLAADRWGSPGARPHHCDC